MALGRTVNKYTEEEDSNSGYDSKDMERILEEFFVMARENTHEKSRIALISVDSPEYIALRNLLSSLRKA